MSSHPSRSFLVAVAAIAAWTMVTVGCSDDRSTGPSSASTSAATSVPTVDPAAPASEPPTSASSTSTSVPVGVGLDGPVTAIELGPPATLDCFPGGPPDPTALCPPVDDEVLGTVTIDGTLVLVTEATEVDTCGPTDGAMATSFEDAVQRLNEVVGLDAYATVVAPPSGSSPGWARASRVFLGSCG